VQIITYREPF